MTTLHEAAQQALEALNFAYNATDDEWVQDTKIMPAIEALRSALAQQGEQPVAWYDEEIDCAYTAKELDGGTSEGLIPLYAGAAPAAQPTCKQDLQVETEQERYVRLCPDIECGRKKKCTRMVGVSCMSRADIAPAAQGCEHCNNPMFAGRKCKNCGREFAGAAPAAQPLTDDQINEIWEKKVPFIEEGGDWFRIFARCIEAAHGIGVQK